MAKDFVIPAFFDAKRAGIQAFSQLVDFKAKATGPRPPDSTLPGQASPGWRLYRVFALIREFQSFFITLKSHKAHRTVKDLPSSSSSRHTPGMRASSSSICDL